MTVIQTQPRILNSADASAIRALVDADPVLHSVLDVRLRIAPDLNPQRLGGFLWGLDDGVDARRLRAAIFHGGNLLPVGHDLDAMEQIAANLARSARGCSSIVGSMDAVQVIWPILARRWGPARAVRQRQPLLSTDRPAPVADDPGLRQVRLDEIERFLPAAVAMFTEELDISPTGRDAGMAYRRRVAELISSGRAYASFDADGQVRFKAEIGALTPATAQIQAVWVRPELRGRGVGLAGMAAMLQHALGLAPTASLYVNDYNLAGRRLYDRLGMRQVNTLRTVLF